MSDWKNKGFDDARQRKDTEEPQKDLIDHVGLGYSDDEVKQHQEEYAEGYGLGTSQRLADSNEQVTRKGDQE